MKITQINTREIKKSLGLDKAVFRYHNKNKTGGNFGIDLIIGSWGNPNFKHYELSGEYDLSGQISRLRVGYAYQLGYNIVEVKDLNELISYIKLMIERGEC